MINNLTGGKKPKSKKRPKKQKVDKLEGMRNNLPLIVWYCSALCRLSYTNYIFFGQGLKFIFNLKVSEKLQRADFFKYLLEERNPNNLKESDFFKKTREERINDLKDKDKLYDLLELYNHNPNFTYNSAQYLSLITNTVFDYLEKKYGFLKLLEKNEYNRTNTYKNLRTPDAIQNLYKKRTKDFIDTKLVTENISYIYIYTGTDLTVQLVYDKNSKKIFVIFKGTDSLRTAYADSRIDTKSITPKERDDGINYGSLHEGFLGHYSHLTHRIAYSIKKLLKNNNDKKEDIDIIVTGHSLGGALATIFSFFWIHWKEKLCKILEINNIKTPIYLITWGQPRVGDENFKKNMLELITKGLIHYKRYKSAGDPFALMPNRATAALKGHDSYYHIVPPIICNSTLTIGNPQNLLKGEIPVKDIDYDIPLQCNQNDNESRMHLHQDLRFGADTIHSLFEAALNLTAHGNLSYIDSKNVVKNFTHRNWNSLGLGWGNYHMDWIYIDLSCIDNRRIYRNYSLISDFYDTNKILHYKLNNICSMSNYRSEFNEPTTNQVDIKFQEKLDYFYDNYSYIIQSLKDFEIETLQETINRIDQLEKNKKKDKLKHKSI